MEGDTIPINIPENGSATANFSGAAKWNARSAVNELKSTRVNNSFNVDILCECDVCKTCMKDFTS